MAIHTSNRRATRAIHARGFTLVELMVAMTISLVLLAGLVSFFVNLSASHRELEKMNGLIENGRFAMQVFQDDLVHAGFWGGHVPQFDDLSSSVIPGDTPTGVPDPCLAYSGWDSVYRTNLLGIPVQTYETRPSGTGCLAPIAKRAGSDALVVRHAETCVPGVGNCEAAVAGRVYLQSTLCAAERNAGTAITASSNTISLDSGTSSIDGDYVGLTLRTTGGLGAGQYRSITAYSGSTHVATVSTPWTVIPNGTTTYSFEYVLGTTSFPLHKRDCLGTGTPATLPISAGTLADRRRLISNIYYISNVAHPDEPGEVIPTLVRSQLDVAGGTPVHRAPVPLVEGIEAFRVELGVDDTSKTGGAIDYTQAIVWVDPATKKKPANRGDGAPDRFIRCTTAAPCTAAQLTNVVAVKIYVLARSRDQTRNYVDTKTYCLGEPAADGTCPVANTIAAANDHYTRHVFVSSMRLTNISGRRETP
jgi:prepilin-type N-terminal cleavage/methylation domain-containing protein